MPSPDVIDAFNKKEREKQQKRKSPEDQPRVEITDDDERPRGPSKKSPNNHGYFEPGPTDETDRGIRQIDYKKDDEQRPGVISGIISF